MREFLYSLKEEYFALEAIDPSDAPKDVYFAFYDEGVHSPLLPIDWRDLDVWVIGDFLSVEEAFPDITHQALIEEWEAVNGGKWDGKSKVFRAYKIRLELFISQKYEGDLSPEEIGVALEAKYTFGAMQELRLDWSSECFAGSIEELELCVERKSKAP